ncbi:MAG TPA: hypothetical protein VL598_14490 [Trinickia sp.]|jgi:hypothetical protein|nr:hypothetical protein [Trinickia sp.]HTI18865.1 hypothetical protein [Trinickia sp.]
MKSKLIAPLLLATFGSLAAPAFASGYGPAPFYNPEVGAPASQRGPSVQTLAAQHDGDRAVGQHRAGAQGCIAVSGTGGGRSASGDTAAPAGSDDLSRCH